jgi:hypothetical protein
VWHERYEQAGLAVVGVHSPEFSWEKPHDKVVEATRRLGVRYPVVQDNDFAIWRHSVRVADSGARGQAGSGSLPSHRGD